MLIGKIGAPSPAQIVTNIYKQQTKPVRRVPHETRYNAVEVTISELAKKLNAELTQAAEKAALDQGD